MMKMRPCLSVMKRTNNRSALAIITLPFLSLSMAVLPLAGGVMPAAAAAQTNQQNGPVNRGPIERIAEGKVVNKAGAPLGGAVVYLKDSHSNAVKTYIADDSGHFRFGQLSQDTDYELWAESNGQRSKSKEISSFDSQNNFYFTLKVDTAKPAPLD